MDDCPSSGETTVFVRHLVLVMLYRWLFGMHTRYSSIWWWAHSRPKHVEERNKHTNKNVHQVDFIYKMSYVCCILPRDKFEEGICLNISNYCIISYLFTYLRTPWSRVLIEKLTGSKIVMKFPVFCETRKFITAITSARHMSLFWASSIQPIPPHPTSSRSVLILSSSHLLLGGDKWVPVTAAWHVLRLRMEERPPMRRVVGECIE